MRVFLSRELRGLLVEVRNLEMFWSKDAVFGVYGIVCFFIFSSFLFNGVVMGTFVVYFVSLIVV